MHQGRDEAEAKQAFYISLFSIAARSVSVVATDGAHPVLTAPGRVSADFHRGPPGPGRSLVASAVIRASHDGAMALSITAARAGRPNRELRVAVGAGRQDLISRVAGGNRKPRQRVRNREPRILGFMLPLDLGVHWRPGAHQPGTYRGDANAMRRELGANGVGEPG